MPLRALAAGLAAIMLLVAETGCGSTGSTGDTYPVAAPSSATETTVAADQTAAKAATRRREARNHSRARKLTRWFRHEKMTPSDLYVLGVDAPESLWKVYGITSLRVRGSKVTIKTDLYPKSDNKNEFAGACNQVVSGYEASWARHIEVLGQDAVVHGSWDDADGDRTDDSSGFMACQSDL